MLAPLQKRQETRHPALPPPIFWDNLSKIPLTRSALQELGRRNNENLLRTQSPDPYLDRTITRRTARKWKLAREAIRPATQYLSHCNSTELKRIGRFSREGGPDLSDLRGYHDVGGTILWGSMSSGPSLRGHFKRGSAVLLENPTTSSSKTKNTGPYDRAFEQNLIDHGVYPDGYRYPGGKALPKPDNLHEIRRELARPRPCLSATSFTDEDFESFRNTAINAHKEGGVFEHVIPILEGRVEDAGCVNGRIPFGNLDHLTDKTLVAGNPDRYYGARPEQLARQVRTQLHQYIVPSMDGSPPIVPNFFFHAKGPDGFVTAVGRQVCYDGALGARGIHKLQAYSQGDANPDNNAYTLALSYYDGVLEIYSIHMLPPGRGVKAGCEYATTHVGGYLLTSSVENFRAGVCAYRNARDWAEKQRNEAIRQANQRFAKVGSNPSLLMEDLNPGSNVGFRHTESSITDIDMSEGEKAMEMPVLKRTRRHYVPKDASTAK